MNFHSIKVFFFLIFPFVASAQVNSNEIKSKQEYINPRNKNIELRKHNLSFHLGGGWQWIGFEGGPRQINADVNYMFNYFFLNSISLSVEPGLFYERQSVGHTVSNVIFIHLPISSNFRYKSNVFNLGINLRSNLGFITTKLDNSPLTIGNSNVSNSVSRSSGFSPNQNNIPFRIDSRIILGYNYILPNNSLIGLKYMFWINTSPISAYSGFLTGNNLQLRYVHPLK